MINKNIIEGLGPHCETEFSPSYCFIITDVQLEESCGQESIKFSLCQINKPLRTCEVKDENGQIIKTIPGILDAEGVYYTKDLTLTGIVEMDDSGNYFTKLIGYEGNRSKLVDNREEQEIYESHHIEVVEAKLSNKISIKFEDSYEKEPYILIDLEKESKNLYKDYDLEYEKEIIRENNKEIPMCSGVKITFNNLKKRKEYPWIKINILEDKNKEEEEEETPETGD